MRIAQIYHGFQRIAGTERFILETSREMSKRNLEVRIYTTLFESGLVTGTQPAIDTKTVSFVRPPLFALYSSLAVSKRLIDAASSWADIIILHSGLSMAQHSWQKFNLPCVPFFHSDQYDQSLFGGVRQMAGVYTFPLKILNNKCVRTIPLAFTNSQSLSNRIRKYARSGRIVSIPLGVDVDRFRPRWMDEGFILMAGRLHPTNNFEGGLAAALNTSCRIVIAGIHENRFSWYYQRLQDTVKNTHRLKGRVEFVCPNEDELVRLIQNCSVFLSPRKYGYLGLAALEAMACGKPVIVYDTDEDFGHLRSVITCGDRISEWQSALGTLMSDSDLRTKIGKDLRQFVEERHTWKNTVDMMLDAAKEYAGIDTRTLETSSTEVKLRC